MSARRLRLVLTEQAQSDVQEIWLYSLRRWGGTRAVAYDEAIQRAFDTLRDNPRLGRARDELRPGLRALPGEDHLVLYRIEEDLLVVQHILHGRQDVSQALHEVEG